MKSFSQLLWSGCCVLLLLLIQPGFSQEELPSSLSGFESSDLFAVTDDVELDTKDAMLRQLVYLCQSLSAESLEHFLEYSKDVSDQQLNDDIQQYRFWVFQKRGRVVRVGRQKLPDELATPEFKEFWLLIVEDGDQTYAVVCRTVPSSWGGIESLSEPIEVTGFLFGRKQMPQFVKSGESIPLFVCDRVSWFPDKESSKANLGAAQLYLASQGVDFGFLDMIRRNQKRGMLAEENRYFYQMIKAATVAQRDPSQVADLPSVGFVELITASNKHLGSVVEIEGNVRRIVAVPITSKAERERLGIDQFYELDMYIPLADIATVKAKDKDGNDIEYNDRFPVTVHIPSLPEAVTEYRHNRVRVKGFFYRMWSFQSEFAKQTNQKGQMSPLIIGFEPKIYRASTQTFDTILTVGAVGFILGLFALIFYLRRSDQNSQSPLRRNDELPETVEIPGMD
jgi:hypothetical protein